MPTTPQNKVKKKYKVRLNSIEKIEELCQLAYDEANQNVVKLQEEINKLSACTNLNNCTVDERSKFAKAMNDYIKSKDMSIGRKMDIVKIMTEVYKHNGNIKNQSVQDSIPTDWESLKDSMYDDQEPEIQEYRLSK